MEYYKKHIYYVINICIILNGSCSLSYSCRLGVLYFAYNNNYLADMELIITVLQSYSIFYECCNLVTY